MGRRLGAYQILAIHFVYFAKNVLVYGSITRLNFTDLLCFYIIILMSRQIFDIFNELNCLNNKRNLYFNRSIVSNAMLNIRNFKWIYVECCSFMPPVHHDFYALIKTINTISCAFMLFALSWSGFIIYNTFLCLAEKPKLYLIIMKMKHLKFEYIVLYIEHRINANIIPWSIDYNVCHSIWTNIFNSIATCKCYLWSFAVVDSWYELTLVT